MGSRRYFVELWFCFGAEIGAGCRLRTIIWVVGRRSVGTALKAGATFSRACFLDIRGVARGLLHNWARGSHTISGLGAYRNRFLSGMLDTKAMMPKRARQKRRFLGMLVSTMLALVFGSCWLGNFQTEVASLVRAAALCGFFWLDSDAVRSTSGT